MLASASPRRHDLLTRAGLSFEVVVPAVEELGSGEPAEVVVANARRKALAVAGRLEHPAVIVAADTDVVLDGEILGKPTDAEAARRTVSRLGGRTHQVLGGLAVISPAGGEPAHELVRSEVTMAPVEPACLERYIASGEWEGKAGGYAVQGLGSGLVTRVDGDLSNVIGLPLGPLLRLLERVAPELLG